MIIHLCPYNLFVSATLKANEIKFQIEAMNIPIGQNRRRGRPSETKPALKKQDYYDEIINASLTF